MTAPRRPELRARRTARRPPRPGGRRRGLAAASVLLAAALAALASTAPAAQAVEDPPPAPDTAAGAAARWRPPVPGDVVRAAAIPLSPWGAGHRGVDLAAAVGDAVTAPADGVVRFVGEVAGRGVVVLEHPGGLQSSFEPVTSSAAVGDVARAGAAVGRLAPGPGHCAPRSCLHWGVRLGESYLDPTTLLERPRIVLMPRR